MIFLFQANEASIRQRARELFLNLSPKKPATTPAIKESSASAPSASAPPAVETEAQKNELRQPKTEKPDDFASTSATASVQSSPLISSDSTRGSSFPPYGSDGGNLPSTSTSQTTSNASVSALKELWKLCQEEEKIRVEQVQVDGEMERLKQEMQRVWYRGKQLEQMSKEIEAKKKELLAGVSEKEKE